MVVDLGNFYVEIDRYNHILYEWCVYNTGKHEGERYGSLVGYFGSMSSCLRRIVDIEAADSVREVSLDGYVDWFRGRIDELNDRYKSLSL